MTAIAQLKNTGKRNNCPCCGSSSLGFVAKIDIEKPTLFGSLEVAPVEVPDLWQCYNCDSRFVQHFVEEQEAIRLYSESSSGARWNTPAFEQDKTATTVKLVAEQLSAGLSILDIGCNTGELLDFAKAKGAITFGLEYSASGAAKAASKGHTIYREQAAAASQLYDLITAFDLVEHLYEPAEFVRFWQQYLKPGGRFIFHTGNACSAPALQSGGRWWYVRLVEHLVFPSQKWYSSLPDLKLVSYTPIWASNYFEGQRKGKQLLKLLRRLPLVSLLAGSYTGIPAMLPDHHLVILEKA